MGAVDVVVALLVAVTLVNTYIEGGTPWMGLVFLAMGLCRGFLVAAGRGVAAAARRGWGRAAPAARRVGRLLVGCRRVAVPAVQRARLDLIGRPCDAADLRDHLLREGISRQVVDVLMSVPRDRFVPAGLRFRAWEDHAMAIGHGQTISQPTVVALMTEAAAVGPGDHVLDVGTGSGYQAAVLAACGARVHSIERLAALSDRARVRLAELGYDVDVRCGDGTAGLAEEAPFDAIVVAAATPTVPPALLDQLREPGEGRRGGRLVIPIGEPSAWFGGQELVVLERVAEGVTRRKLLDVVFVPLVWEPTGTGQ